jgi:hypothetical protein
MHMLTDMQSFIRKLYAPTLGLSTADGSEEYRLWGQNDNIFRGFAPAESLKHNLRLLYTVQGQNVSTEVK